MEVAGEGKPLESWGASHSSISAIGSAITPLHAACLTKREVAPEENALAVVKYLAEEAGASPDPQFAATAAAAALGALALEDDAAAAAAAAEQEQKDEQDEEAWLLETAPRDFTCPVSPVLLTEPRMASDGFTCTC